MIVVTGATGHLGRLVIEALLKKLPAREIAGAARNPEKAKDLAARGVEVRRADYSKPETLRTAFAGAHKLLFVSSSEVGQRASQHAAVVQAAKEAGVKLLAYTSILRAETSRLALAAEHKAEVSRQAGKLVAYRDLPPDQYRAVLTGAGLPASYAALLVDADVQVARGELDDSTGELRRLIGRPTTPLATAVRAALGR